MPKSTDNLKGWMPNADKIGIPTSNFTAGHAGRRAVVGHIAVGSYVSVIQEFTAPKGKSSHFLVSREGQIAQFVSIYDTSYANGLTWAPARKCWIDPQGIALKVPRPTPTWVGLTPPVNPNLTTVTIEREGKPEDKPTEAMDNATVLIMRYLAAAFAAFKVYTPHVNLIGHWEISPVNRANCPGPHFDYEGLAAAANGPKPTLHYIARHTQAVFEAPRADSKVALADTARIIEGARVELDEVRPDGFGHLADGLGFVPVGVLSKV